MQIFSFRQLKVLYNIVYQLACLFQHDTPLLECLQYLLLLYCIKHKGGLISCAFSAASLTNLESYLQLSLILLGLQYQPHPLYSEKYLLSFFGCFPSYLRFVFLNFISPFPLPFGFLCLLFSFVCFFFS